jgi:hypothetical protein
MNTRRPIQPLPGAKKKRDRFSQPSPLTHPPREASKGVKVFCPTKTTGTTAAFAANRVT